MKKAIIYTLFSLSTIGYAQDQLFKKDNSKVEVKILEINQTEIKYKLFTYQDGPTISIAKKEVALIIYQNGVHEVLNTVPEPVPVTVYTGGYTYAPSVRINQDSIDQAAFKALVSTKNLVSFNTMDPINGSFTINYIREFANNYLHVYVPVSVGFATPLLSQAINTTFAGNNNYYNNYNYNNYFTVNNFKFTNKTYEVGLGLHFQTSGKHAVTHFIGPYIGFAEFKGTYDKSTTSYDPLTGQGNYTSTFGNPFTIQRTNIMLDNGVLFRVTKNFNIMLLAAIGYHIDQYTSADNLSKAYNYNKNQFPLNAFKFGLSFGYRF